MPGRRLKYGNQKVRDGTSVFDSKKEYCRYYELLLLQQAGEISGLRRQERFMIVPKKNGVRRARYYTADFVYTAKDGVKVIEDVKSEITKKNPVYTLKRDLVLWQYPEFRFVET